MPNIKPITLAQAKARTAETQEKQENVTKPREKVTESEEILIQEEAQALEKLAKQDEEETQDQIDLRKAKEMKEKIQAKKNAPRKPSTSRKSRWWKKPRPCERCKKTIEPKDSRTRFCHDCANKVKAEIAKLKAWRPRMVRSEVEEKLRPFLRIWLTLREACLEAEISHTSVCDYMKEWEWFRDFIERHQNYMVIKARRNIFANIGANDKETVATSKWYLEKKRSDEFWNKLSVDAKVDSRIISPEKEQALEELSTILWSWTE